MRPAEARALPDLQETLIAALEQGDGMAAAAAARGLMEFVPGLAIQAAMARRIVQAAPGVLTAVDVSFVMTGHASLLHDALTLFNAGDGVGVRGRTLDPAQPMTAGAGASSALHIIVVFPEYRAVLPGLYGHDIDVAAVIDLAGTAVSVLRDACERALRHGPTLVLVADLLPPAWPIDSAGRRGSAGWRDGAFATLNTALRREV